MGAKLLIDGMDVCQTDPNNTACNGKAEGNRFNFTMNVTAENKRYRCHVHKRDPLPVLTREGEDIGLLPGEKDEPCLQNKLCQLY